MDILSRMRRINQIRAVKAEKTRIVYTYENGIDRPEHVAVTYYKEIKVYCYNTNICTIKYCKFILNHSDMFRCQYTIFREFTVVLAKVMNC